MKKYKKRILTYVPILLFAVFLLLFFSSKRANEFYDETKVNHIGIRNGNSGNYMDVTDQEDMKSILTYMEKVSFRRRPSMPWGGYSYSLTFYNNDTEIANIIYADDIADIDGNTYSIRNDNDTSMEKLMQGLKHSQFVESK